MEQTRSRVRGVVVTGGSSGIGCAAVNLLAQKGYIVFATGRNEPALRALEPLGVGWAVGDISDPETVEKQWAAALQFFESKNAEPFGLCLNAGCAAGRMPFEQLSVDQLGSVLNTNVLGPMLWLRVALPLLKERRCGQVVLTSSMAAVRACPEQALYAASKSALHGMLLSLRAELKDSGVKVASVNPGAVATAWWTDPSRGGYTEDMRSAVAATPMWNAMLDPTDVATQIVALLEQPTSVNTESVMLEPSGDVGATPPQ